MNRVVRLRPLAAVGGVTLAGLLLVHGSQAAFTGSTANDGNTFSAATVVLTDDDSGAALFTATGMTPGNPVVQCVAVSYTGTTTAVDVGLHAAVTAGDGLDGYLDLTVERGTGGGPGNCTGFTADADPGATYSGTLAAFVTTHGSYPARFSSWAPSATPQTVTYRITADVASDNAAQGKTTTATFTWEGQTR